MRYFIERRFRDSGKLRATDRAPQIVRTPCVLVIENEPDTSPLIEARLRNEAYVERCGCSEAELRLALERPWTLIVVDVARSQLDGVDIRRQLPRLDGCAPLLILTASSGDPQRLPGLEAVAQDRLARPFSADELIACTRAILLRVGTPESAGAVVLRARDLALDLERREVRRDGKRLRLTVREFDLLAHLMRNRGKVYSRAQLLREVWGASAHSDEHTVSSHINRLRAKLEPEPGVPRYVVTVWGVGYRFVGE